MYEAINSLSDSVVRKNWIFPFAVGIDATIEDCQYFSTDDAYLVRALVNWSGPREGLLYESRVKFIISAEGSWEFELLDANANLKEHFVSNALPFKAAESLAESLAEPQSYNIVCINNIFDADMTFSASWEREANWETKTIKAKKSKLFWSTINDKLFVRYDAYNDSNGNSVYVTQELTSNVTKDKTCDLPVTYTILVDEETQGIMFSQDWKPDTE